MSQKKKGVSPLKAKPLRSPGDSVNEVISDELFDHFFPHLTLVLVGAAVILTEWIRWGLNTPINPWIVTLFGLSLIAYCVIRIWQRLPKLRALRQGRDGEKAVGQYLDRLRVHGFQVFHDIPGDGFNLDHVVLSPFGILSIETKTFSKPEKGEAKIVPTDEGLVIDGRSPDPSALIQAVAQAKWLESLLLESTGKTFKVRPVVVFPGWYVERNRTLNYKGIWILNPKALPKFLENEPPTISESDMHLAAYHLSRHIRNR